MEVQALDSSTIRLTPYGEVQDNKIIIGVNTEERGEKPNLNCSLSLEKKGDNFGMNATKVGNGSWILNQNESDPGKISSLQPIIDANAKWEERYQLLLKHKAKYGTVEIRKQDNPLLYAWILRQRQLYQYGGLAAEKKKKLHSAGIHFNNSNPNTPHFTQQSIVRAPIAVRDPPESKDGQKKSRRKRAEDSSDEEYVAEKRSNKFQKNAHDYSSDYADSDGTSSSGEGGVFVDEPHPNRKALNNDIKSIQHVREKKKKLSSGDRKLSQDKLKKRQRYQWDENDEAIMVQLVEKFRFSSTGRIIEKAAKILPNVPSKTIRYKIYDIKRGTSCKKVLDKKREEGQTWVEEMLKEKKYNTLTHHSKSMVPLSESQSHAKFASGKGKIGIKRYLGACAAHRKRKERCPLNCPSRKKESEITSDLEEDSTISPPHL